jgi:hypothetical protein
MVFPSHFCSSTPLSLLAIVVTRRRILVTLENDPQSSFVSQLALKHASAEIGITSG